jgi:hypothetical protein
VSGFCRYRHFLLASRFWLFFFGSEYSPFRCIACTFFSLEILYFSLRLSVLSSIREEYQKPKIYRSRANKTNSPPLMTAFATSIHRDDRKKQNENLHIKVLNLSAFVSSNRLHTPPHRFPIFSPIQPSHDGAPISKRKPCPGSSNPAAKPTILPECPRPSRSPAYRRPTAITPSDVHDRRTAARSNR